MCPFEIYHAQMEGNRLCSVFNLSGRLSSCGRLREITRAREQIWTMMMLLNVRARDDDGFGASCLREIKMKSYEDSLSERSIEWY